MRILDFFQEAGKVVRLMPIPREAKAGFRKLSDNVAVAEEIASGWDSVALAEEMKQLQAKILMVDFFASDPLVLSHKKVFPVIVWLLNHTAEVSSETIQNG